MTNELIREKLINLHHNIVGELMQQYPTSISAKSLSSLNDQVLTIISLIDEEDKPKKPNPENIMPHYEWGTLSKGGTITPFGFNKEDPIRFITKYPNFKLVRRSIYNDLKGFVGKWEEVQFISTGLEVYRVLQ